MANDASPHSESQTALAADNERSLVTRPEPKAAAPRLVSLDAYRGFIMLLMVSSGFALPEVAKLFPSSDVWRFLGEQSDHVLWTGCVLWDLIQPSFMFMVGVAMPYSYVSRLAKGDSPAKIFVHVWKRALILVLLGIFLSSNWSRQTNFTFVNVLTQIGLGYPFVHLLLGRSWRVQLAAIVAILAGTWLWFALTPVPSLDIDLRSLGINEPCEVFTGFFAHWTKNTNAAAVFDTWFLNLFPWPLKTDLLKTGVVNGAFVFNRGGYQTLNFIPSMATMILGVMAGELLRGERTPRGKFWMLCLAGATCLSLGWIWGATLCPIVKRIWTPSWTLFSAGWTFWLLAGFYYIIDICGWKRWSFPLVVVGMNSIAIYCMSNLLKPWIRDTLQRHLGAGIYDGTYFQHEFFAPMFAPIAQATAFLLVLWLVSLWMYRQKIFIRI